jgi:hypothetical protein
VGFHGEKERKGSWAGQEKYFNTRQDGCTLFISYELDFQKFATERGTKLSGKRIDR